MDIINKHNWREFKTEPYLSDDELVRWNELKDAALKDVSLFDYIIERTKKEYDEYKSISTDNWFNLVKSSDAYYRLLRGEIKAYESFIAKEFMSI